MPSQDPPSPAELEWERLQRDPKRYAAWAEQTRAAWLESPAGQAALKRQNER